jgi:phosphatidate cytidylyltransferase
VLLTRVLTALALLPVILALLFFASPAGWALFALVIALLACWEWSRMCGFTGSGQALYLVASAAIGAYVLALFMHFVPGNFAALALTSFIIAAFFWLVGAPLWLARLARPNSSMRAVAGWLVAWPTWFALVMLRETSPWILLAVAALVWVADIAAYFAGKGFGRNKLAPAISPGKTWEGVAGALVGVAIYGAILGFATRGHDTPLRPVFESAGLVPAILVMLVLAGISVVGDLFESWMKRGAGLKDSSQLLPGHGGVLDRIDALTAVLPLAALTLFLVEKHS